MSSSWFIVLGELSVLFICLYWYLQHNHERKFAVVIEHESIEGMPLGKVEELISRRFVVREIRLADSSNCIMHPDDDTVLHHGDHLLIQARPHEIEPIIAFLGQRENTTK